MDSDVRLKVTLRLRSPCACLFDALVIFLCVFCFFFQFFFCVSVQFFIVKKIYAAFCHNSNALKLSLQWAKGCSKELKNIYTVFPLEFCCFSLDPLCSLSFAVAFLLHFTWLVAGLLRVVFVVVVPFKISLSRPSTASAATSSPFFFGVFCFGFMATINIWLNAQSFISYVSVRDRQREGDGEKESEIACMCES